MNNFCFIILHYKDSIMTNQCLDSVFAMAESVDEIIVVDNSYDYDVSGTAVLDNEVSFKVISPPELNPGFARGMNFGASQAAPCVYLTFINNDTIIPPEFRQEMQRSFKIGGKKLAAVGPKIVYASHPEIIQSTGMSDPLFRLSANFVNKNKFSKDITGHFSIDMLTGCVLTIRTDLFSCMNGWPDAYFFGGEDSELSVRLKKLGYNLAVNADVSVKHFADIDTGHGASHSKEDLFVIMNAYANHLLLKKRTSSISKLIYYRLYLSFFMICLMPIKWRNIGGQTHFWRKVRLTRLIRREIFSKNMNRIDKDILDGMAQNVWSKFNEVSK